MFGKKKSDPTAIATLIGAGTTVTGDLDFRGGLHLDGRIIGDVRGDGDAPASLTIGSEGVIDGSVSVNDLVLKGAVRGDVTVRERVELGPTAQVDGNVTYRVLQMAEGARVNGRLIYHPGGQQALPSPAPEKPAEAGPTPEGDEAPWLR
jgi:cytoskeletal protein CcmA (bactofilin family)